METDKILILISSDSEKISISSKVCQKSTLVKGMIEDFPNETQFPMYEIKGRVLKKIKDYLEYYEDKEPKQIEKPLRSMNFRECVDEWDYNYINVDKELIFEIILGANFMDIKPLLELALAKIASIIKGKSTEDIRKILDITNDFSPEEEQKIIEENKWCEENL